MFILGDNKNKGVKGGGGVERTETLRFAELAN